MQKVIVLLLCVFAVVANVPVADPLPEFMKSPTNPLH